LGERPQGVDIVADRLRVGRGQFAQVLFQPVDIAVHAQRGAGRPLHAEDLLGIEHRPPVQDTQFFPQGVEPGGRGRPDEAPDTAVQGVALALPAGAQASGPVA
jgi:hypothetical protein